MKKAIELLQAKKISKLRYAYYADECCRYYVVSTKGLKKLEELINSGEKDAYSHWCSGEYGKEMPKGWSHNQRAFIILPTLTLLSFKNAL
jgi:hypothetical protein